jgi:ABC-type phosphate transport system substrate-binding protein
MSLKRTLLLLSALALFLPLMAGAQEAAYKVIVNTANASSSLTKHDVADIFLKKNVRWASGAPIVVADQTDKSPAREAFCTDVLHKNVASVKSYWQQQIFSGRELPPVEKATDEEVIAFVQGNPNAIGYVSKKTVTDGVKVIRITG